MTESEPVKECGTDDDIRRQLFRAMIDYSDSFELAERHRGMILWRDGEPQKGVNLTNLCVQLVQDHSCVLGILPHDTANEWTLESFEHLLERFRSKFHVEQINLMSLQPESDGTNAGTGSAVLRHRLFDTVRLRIVGLKKTRLNGAVDSSDVFLVDNQGQSIVSKKFKRVQVFTFEFVTNSDRLDDWDQYRQVKRRRRLSKKSRK